MLHLGKRRGLVSDGYLLSADNLSEGIGMFEEEKLDGCILKALLVIRLLLTKESSSKINLTAFES